MANAGSLLRPKHRRLTPTVTPAQAGVQPASIGRDSGLAREGNRRSRCRGGLLSRWIPAYAGMT